MPVNIEIQVTVYITLALSTASLALRLLARHVSSVALWWDDWFSIIAYFFSAAFSVISLIWAFDGGLGRPNAELAPRPVEEILEQGTFLLYMIELFYAFALAVAKFSILAFYWRLFKTSKIRVPIQVMAVASMIWLILRTFLAIFHCVPVEAFWDRSIENATCAINDSEFFFGTVLTHLLIDIVILALPVIEVRNLQLRTAQKGGVIMLFMFGIFVCIASVVVLVESLRYDASSEEMNTDILQIIVWANVEVNLAIVSACLPMMRPIFRYFVPGNIFSSGGQSQPLGTRSTKGIKLTEIRTKRSGDDDSSTHQLAEAERGSLGGNGSDNDLPGGGSGGTRTMISGRAYEDSRSEDPSKGIMVKNETHITVEHV